MIDKFLAKMRKENFARTNRFAVRIPFPDPKGKHKDRRLTELFCDSTTLPGIDIATTPVKIYGESREMPYERMYNPVNMTFYVDGDMVIKTMFDDWFDKIFDPTTRVLSYLNEYARDIDIKVLNVGEEASDFRYTVTLHDAWPKSIGAVTMDYSHREVMKLSVTFVYKYWTSTNNSTPTTFLP